ncbi:hypothetical protein DPEC_G00126310 [Dallia pectoralis]|uniref:Uncharacterized protein n=3 Tax=Dallia pectoralis TaxID=75939 RepID=A0ACC2GS57_DALPE|nr:hypothetical protein DPEC_G00217850 [Dallia pectoralis]KAJ7998007.1 hypothetical protein DPEC_G00218080 [Dallia pectoralis]KAJ8006246.1 hypothetical protein DPEC_G00126310 [Dallia pectoralis]
MDTLVRGDKVRIQSYDTHKSWRPAKVVQQVSHRSYEVELESGGVLRRRNYTEPTPTQNNPTTTGTVAAVAPGGLAENQDTITRSGRQVVRPSYLKD